ncbi:hypothetical protein HOD05_00800 [Candidatus Woesearchaeota archaeon]|nr:hypothetical protein [Candidatus Woesearchaeota archaeon]MBT4150945.1 hypothetical protein [Candidatus Woesearchaeota archaeon]MBT4247318.1 hypothetical protein [Candidatus Woesearchaeota archaeon]MBT4433735.1 hypothetical protein [Candidatus Woesearchaeota archaeon]MBT7332256.1 hypothetical protein [Candidatus Woesearchaeota archaeon]
MTTLEEIFENLNRYAKVNNWRYVVDDQIQEHIRPSYVLFLSALHDMGKPMPKHAFLDGKPSDNDMDKLISLGYVTEIIKKKRSYIKVSDIMKKAEYIHS